MWDLKPYKEEEIGSNIFDIGHWIFFLDMPLCWGKQEQKYYWDFIKLKASAKWKKQPTLKGIIGIPGWCSRLAPVFGPGRDPGNPGSNPTSGSRCMEPASPSACVSASISVTIIKKIKKEVKNSATLRFQNCRARYLPRGYKSHLVDSKRDT